MASDEHFPSTYEGLLRLVERLRGPDGCPWDREHTHRSLTRGLLEECYELIEAIEQDDAPKLVEELGDVLFHVLLQVQIGKEAGEFTPQKLYEALIDKLARRHPHVFGDVQVADAREVEANWDLLKRREKGAAEASMLDGVPRHMPALLQAQEIQSRAARAGFDWEDVKGVLDKVGEELAGARSEEEREWELGDLLFSVVNTTRWLGADAERALRQANARFRQRFGTMERLAREQGLSFPDLALTEQDALWQEAKALES